MRYEGEQDMTGMDGGSRLAGVIGLRFSGKAASWGDEADFGEIGSVALGVAGQEGVVFGGGVGTDIEIGEGGAPVAPFFAVAEKGLGGEKAGGVG